MLGQQRRRDDRQRRVLVSGGRDRAREPVAAFDHVLDRGGRPGFRVTHGFRPKLILWDRWGAKGTVAQVVEAATLEFRSTWSANNSVAPPSFLHAGPRLQRAPGFTCALCPPRQRRPRECGN